MRRFVDGEIIASMDPADSPEAIDQLPVAVAQQVDITHVVSPHLVVTVPGALIIGLLRDVQSRAGSEGVAIARALIGGQPPYMAALNGGISHTELQRRRKADPELSEAYSTAENIGIACTIEAELHRRAMAGPEDRGSMRALELALKSRRADYRDRQQVETTHIIRASEAADAYAGDWHPPAS